MSLPTEVPNIIMQTSFSKPEDHIRVLIDQRFPGWKYQHYVDDEIIEYFHSHPLPEFPHILKKFHEFSKGQHKADLFRYYFLYIEGGVFMDSDAMIETEIQHIIKNYRCVFVRSFMETPHLYNGFIAVDKQNPIIYRALQHAYHTENHTLLRHYHYLCEELLRIYQELCLPNTKVYQEINKIHDGYGGSIIVDEEGKKMMSHYFFSKVIPITVQNYLGTNPHSVEVDIDSFHPQRETRWNEYHRNEWNEFDPKVLTVYDTGVTLKRIGRPHDGGYVIVKDIQDYDFFLSCGIADDISFEDAFLDEYPDVECICFDGTISSFPKSRHPMQWVPKNIGCNNNRETTNLKDYLQNYERIFLKMDIEGSEFNWIEAMKSSDLDRFQQIVMEIHWPFDTYRCAMLSKLNETHYIIHIHGNNYCNRDMGPIGRTFDGTETFLAKDGSPWRLPEVMEITYLHKKCVDPNIVKKISKTFPTPIDHPNNPYAPDITFTIS